MEPNFIQEPQQNTQPTTNQSPPAERKRLLSKKKIVLFVVIGVLIILLLALGLSSIRTLNQANQTQPNADVAVSGKENLLLATVGDRQVYRSNVEKIARESLLPSGITDDVVKEKLNQTIERVILDIEAEKKGISNVNPNPVEYYEELRRLVVIGEVQSAEAYTIDYWVPAPGVYEQRPEFETQRQDGLQAMIEAETRLESGEDPLEVAKYLYNAYPTLQPILAFNGFLMNGIMQTPGYSDDPKVYEHSPGSEDTMVPDFIFSLGEGEVGYTEFADDSGGIVAKIVSVSTGEPIDYSTWLEQKKQELVTYNQKNIDSL